MKLSQRLYWIIPVLFLTVGTGILFFQNLLEVTEVPEDDWSRAIPIGELSGNKAPIITEQDNQLALTYFENETLVQDIYDQNLNFVTKEAYQNLPFDKWTQAFIAENTVLYHDYYHIYDGETNEQITAANGFFPLSTSLFYQKELTLYKLDPTTYQSYPLVTFDREPEGVIPKQTDDGKNVLFTYTRDVNQLHLTLFDLTKDQADIIYESSLAIGHDEQVVELNYAINEDQLAVVLKLKRKPQGGGTPIITTKFMETNISDAKQTQLMELTFGDPKSDYVLDEVGDISIAYVDSQVNLLFSALGSTETTFKDADAFNIYQAVEHDGEWVVQRRSNTSGLSTKPAWMMENQVLWLEKDGANSTLYVSSNDPEIINRADSWNRDDFLNALGKTLGMLSVSLFTLFVTAIWYLVPFTLISLGLLVNRRVIDGDPSWIYYSGVGVYLLTALLFKDNLFIDNVYQNGPDYLTFTNSDFVYIIGFALIAHLTTLLGARRKDWSRPIDAFYFILVHILLLTIFFGPYLI
ncbi:hypothetical protein [Radiobacillus sp. PE A8.2]|uniref:hypothetical protein n=1 Tax=Radiobacillus sp. PE A8.2 TaxID=3380349 RepID=UPI00388EC2DB